MKLEERKQLLRMQPINPSIILKVSKQISKVANQQNKLADI
jgi:hypothetical protein